MSEKALSRNHLFHGGRCAIALLAASLLAVFAFGVLFTTFVFWDDEGFFLISYHDFLSGHTLYDQVFSLYGPLAFFIAGVVARFHAVNVTHDAFRWITLPVWIAIAGLLGGVVWRWTGRFALALVVFLLAGWHLQGLAKAIGHPQLWIIAATALLLWLGSDWASQVGKERRAFWTGLLAAAILLLKVNIGLFVLLTIAILVSLHLTGSLRIAFSTVLILAAFTLGVMLYVSTPTNAEKFFAVAYLASVATIVGAVVSQSTDRQIRRACVPWLAVGFGLCVCAGLGLTLALGTAPRALFDNLISATSGLAKTYHYPFVEATHLRSVVTSLMGFGAALIVLWGRRLLTMSPLWLGLFKAAAGTGVLVLYWRDDRAALTGSLLFMWLLVADISKLGDQGYFNRFLLALLAALFSLQLYPMAGEQVNWAGLMPMTAGAVVLADGLNLISRETDKGWLHRLSARAVRAAAILLAGILLVSTARMGRATFLQWRTEQSVNLPGAKWLHLPANDTRVLTTTVGQLASNCQTAFFMPGLYSYSLWSGVPPFEARHINSWPFLWPQDVERREISAIRQKSHSCVLLSRLGWEFYRFLAVSKGNEDLVTEVQRTMRPIAVVEDAFDKITLYRPSSDTAASH